jgi:hypothetical protein
MHDMAVALDGELLGHFHRPHFGDASDVITAEIEQQLLFQLVIDQSLIGCRRASFSAHAMRLHKIQQGSSTLVPLLYRNQRAWPDAGRLKNDLAVLRRDKMRDIRKLRKKGSGHSSPNPK